eukprot:TRINITY_DN103355_c0_g1_i1.p1 TRINITY_DN103355_c0_g1~~TRINITY_DN103355_c0_g1_i1.p1  ORF type:complete len:446 (-),score=78.28 TRINITY_DN103355_c0_g1_i1:42-1379(-)
MAQPEIDDVAEEQGADEGDRARIRTLQALLNARRWESLLNDPSLDLPDAGTSSSSRAPLPPGGASKAPAAEPPLLEEPAASASGADHAAHRRGMVRHVYLLVDMTDAARQPDYKPRRLEFAVEAAGRFLSRFLAENPLSELGLGVLRGGTCEAVAPFGEGQEELSGRLFKAAQGGPRGRMSIVNGLQRAANVLESAPPYATKEVLLLFASLSTFDPAESPIDKLIAPLVEKRVRVSVVSMSAELAVLRRICTETSGSYAVALDTGHYYKLLDGHVPAPACSDRALVPQLIRMGFPRQARQVCSCGQEFATSAPICSRCRAKRPQVTGPGICACHSRRRARLFVCPQCETRVCSVPGRCPMCELPLASAPLIARTFRQLVPVPPFQRLLVTGAASTEAARQCGGCQATLSAEKAFQCPTCRGAFCKACDDFVHEALKTCPGCAEIM